MKVIFLTEGGKDIGFGHITRCISLSHAFEEKKIRPVFIINGDSAVRDFLENRKGEIFNWLKEKRLFKIIEDASAVIIDSYLAGAGIYKKISDIAKVPVYIDDNKRLRYPKGLVVNGTTYASGLGYPEKKGVRYLLGSKYILLRKEFWNVRKKKIKDKLENILITFGGEDFRNMTPDILRLLNEHYPFMHKMVIVGKGFRNKDEIEALKDKKTELLRNLDARGMKKAMQASDVAISAGGQTLYELAATGVPTIGICVAGNQRNNLEGWQREGFVEYAGEYKDAGLPAKIRSVIKRLSSHKLRLNMSESGIRLVDGQGAKRIIQEIMACQIRGC